jgi:hypothetical protein
MPSEKSKKIKLVWNSMGHINYFVCAADVNLLGNSVNAIKENTGTLLEASRDIGLEINAEKQSI